MKLKRMLTIPGFAAAALVLAACSVSGSVEVGPFPNETPREVSARSETNPAAANVTVGANSSQLFLVTIPDDVADSDVVWFVADETSGVASIELYDVNAFGQERVRLRSIAAGWFDVPGSTGVSPSALADLAPAQIVSTFSCTGPCVAITGAEAGSSRYVRVNSDNSGAEFDLFVFGRDVDYPGGETRGAAIELDVEDDAVVGALSLSGKSQWYTADNVSSVTLGQPADADGQMEFEATVYVGTTVNTVAAGDTLALDGPTNDVYIEVRSFNDTRAAAAGDARFTVLVE